MSEPIALIVENDVRTAARFEAILAEAGLHLMVAPNPRSALKLMENVSLSLLLLDLDRPPRESLRLLGDMRDRGISAPVVWLTANPSSDAIERVRASGGQGVLDKVAHSKTTLRAIQAVLSGDRYFAPQMTHPATPGAKALAESERLLHALRGTPDPN